MAYFGKRYHPPGTQPGTLVRHAAVQAPLRVTVLDYDAAGIDERHDAGLDDYRAYLAAPRTTWIHVQGDIGPERLRELGAVFDLHPLALEDVLNIGQRPKAETYNDQLFVVLAMPRTVDKQVKLEQVSLFLGPNYLISFNAGIDDPFAPVRTRLHAGGAMRGLGAEFLLYSLIDLVIDQGYPVLEDFGENIEDLETRLLSNPDERALADIHGMKRELLLLRRMLWPQRDLVSNLLRDPHRLIGTDTRLYLRDCYDHSVQIIDLIETYRDMTASMLDVYLSSVSHRLNDIMRVLTVISTVFIPPTFIAGVYGMNFSRGAGPWSMPELDWTYGYPLAWLLMLVMGAGMLVYFKRRKWF